MLNVGYHDAWGVEVELLDCAVRSDSEQTGPRAVDGKPFDVFKCWNRVKGDMFCPNIP